MPAASHREDSPEGQALNLPETRYISGAIFEPKRESSSCSHLALALQREDTLVGHGLSLTERVFPSGTRLEPTREKMPQWGNL